MYLQAPKNRPSILMISGLFQEGLLFYSLPQWRTITLLYQFQFYRACFSFHKNDIFHHLHDSYKLYIIIILQPHN